MSSFLQNTAFMSQQAYTVTYRKHNGPLFRAVLFYEDFPPAAAIQSVTPYKHKEAHIPFAIHGHNSHTKKYLVQWRGYPNPADWTWEPFDNLGNYTYLAIRYDMAAVMVKKEVSKTAPKKSKSRPRKTRRPQMIPTASHTHPSGATKPLRRSKRRRTSC